MVPLDGVDNPIEVLQILKNELDQPNWLCVLVGSGSETESLRRRSRDAGLAEQVRFVGRVTHEEVLPFIAGMALCVIPDPVNDYSRRCTLIKAAEYMAQGKPFVSFDLDETRLAVGDAEVYVRDGDDRGLAVAIAELLADPEKRGQMGDRGRARAQAELVWCHSIPPLLRAYDQLWTRRASVLVPAPATTERTI
jgi:glycosyltransferase involved in cell wall biosynthesis